MRHLTLRTPTLDDVFLELTGNHIEPDEPAESDRSHETLRRSGHDHCKHPPLTSSEDGPASPGPSLPALRDVASIAGRALRAVPRELETVIPPIFIALFFFVVNIGTLQHLTESHIKGFDIKAFMLPTAILLGVTGVSRAGSLVLDIQDGYFDRLLLTPVRRLAILSATCSPTSPSPAR